jgi:hypothetical protein
MDCDFAPQLKQKKRILRRAVEFTFDISNNTYYDVSGNETIVRKPTYRDGTNEILEYKNPLYSIVVDDSYNLFDVKQNILDSNGEIQWEDSTEQEYAYEIRYVDPSGNVITKEQYDSTISNGGLAYIAAFVGCTYHCG